MKNKSKKKKPQHAPKPIRRAPDVPDQWLYLTPEEIKLRSIYEIFKDANFCRAELWEEAGALEIAVREAGSMDLEQMESDLGDENDNAYLAEHQIKSVFAVTIMPEAFEKMRPIMEKIMEHTGGFFCGDTKDFKPEVKLPE